jgi:hypothetical protein
LRAYGDRERDFLYGFPPHLGNGHLNATGNKVSGALIADWLCQQSSSDSGFMRHGKSAGIAAEARGDLAHARFSRRRQSLPDTLFQP